MRLRLPALPLALLLLLAGCPSHPPDPWKENAGVYWGRFPAADAQERIVTLWLDEGGTARLETVYVGKGRTPLEQGRWSATGMEITVQLQDASGVADQLVFRRVGKQLLPEEWNRERYGRDGLALDRRWP